MPRRPALLMAPLPLLAQVAPEDAKVLELQKAKNWSALVEHIESLPPKDRGRHLMAWVMALHRGGRNERALQICEAVLTQLPDPRNPQAMFAQEFKARSLGALGRNGEAGAAWEALGQLPGRTSELSNAVVEYRNARDWPAMERCARLLIERGPGLKPLGEAWLGEAMARQDHFPEAEPLLRSALASQPKQPFAWTNLARCLNEKKAWQEAMDACNEALVQDPGQMEALYNRGRAAFELKRYPQAVADFEAALTLLPGDPILQANLQQAKGHIDNKTKAIKGNK